MRLGAFDVNEPLPALNKPHALAMLQPWIDVGGVGTLIITQLETQLKAQELARLARPGEFFDFTRYRPTIHYREGERQLIIPNTYVTYTQRETGNDFLFLHLLEPHNRGEDYVESISHLLNRFDIQRYCLLGSMYDLVTHSRPLAVTGGTDGKMLERQLDGMGIKSSNYQGPTSITSLISQNARDIGVETLTLIVHLPQYTQIDEDYVGAVRLMTILNTLYDLPTNESYVRKAERQLEQVNIALENNPELKTIIAELERHYDEHNGEILKEDSPQLSPEVEKFLNEMERRFRED